MRPSEWYDTRAAALVSVMQQKKQVGASFMVVVAENRDNLVVAMRALERAHPSRIPQVFVDFRGELETAADGGSEPPDARALDKVRVVSDVHEDLQATVSG